MRADKFLFHHKQLGKKAAQQSIAQGRLRVNDQIVLHIAHEVGEFDRVILDDEVLAALQPRYIMLHKPEGYVCATTDNLSPTVLDLLSEIDEELHLAGRLDKFTTGLVLLTNNGKWSRSVTMPESKIPKVYHVGAENEITDQMVDTFREGIFFEKEKIKTQPAAVEVISPLQMKLTIYEGMHHQIKRMFLKFNNRVVQLHRESIGNLCLDIAEGEFRDLTASEVGSMIKICSPHEPSSV